MKNFPKTFQHGILFTGIFIILLLCILFSLGIGTVTPKPDHLIVVDFDDNDYFDRTITFGNSQFAPFAKTVDLGKIFPLFNKREIEVLAMTKDGVTLEIEILFYWGFKVDQAHELVNRVGTDINEWARLHVDRPLTQNIQVVASNLTLREIVTDRAQVLQTIGHAQCSDPRFSLTAVRALNIGGYTEEDIANTSD